MLRCTPFQSPRRAITAATILLAITTAVVPVQTAFALITGGEGNTPRDDPGWPKGAAAIFNNPARIAWWAGPPFGGGQWHAECRGDAKAFNAVIADFAKLDLKSKRVVIHNGVGHSFWFDPNREPGKRAAAEIDWVFMVWEPANWERVTYDDVPPGRYVLQGRPNPYTADQQSKPLTIELKGGETIDATLSTK
jgi:hypothetical protein